MRFLVLALRTAENGVLSALTRQRCSCFPESSNTWPLHHPAPIPPVQSNTRPPRCSTCPVPSSQVTEKQPKSHPPGDDAQRGGSVVSRRRRRPADDEVVDGREKVVEVVGRSKDNGAGGWKAD